MNLSQLHERLRLELLRRIQRGTLSLSLFPARQDWHYLTFPIFYMASAAFPSTQRTASSSPSRWALQILLPAQRFLDEAEQAGMVPLVSHDTAMHEPVVRPSAVRRILHIPEELLRDTRSRSGPARKAWLRFVAIHVSAADAAAMSPVILPDALVVLDRHYNSLVAYHPDRPNLYAVRHDAQLLVRYADFRASRLVLRPHMFESAVELVEMAGEETPGDFIAGRVIVVINPL